MSMTKRMMESPSHWTKADRAAQRKAWLEGIDDVFSKLRKYLVAFVRANTASPISKVHKRLFPNAMLAPSQSKFYSDVKKAGGVPAYLTHHFYNNLQASLEALSLPPSVVSRLLRQKSKGPSYFLSLEDAARFSPTEAELASAASLKPKARRFRHHPKAFPDFLPAKGIYDFFTEIHRKNEAFYSANPAQLFNLELLDYAEDYLHSPFWFVIRNIVLFRDGFECRLCKKQATTVHHLYYNPDVLYGKDLDALVSLCESCHSKIEFDDSGNKIHDIEQKRRRFEALAHGG